MQRRGCFVLLILVLVAVTIVLALIPVYLTKSPFETKSVAYTLQVVYATNFKNATYLVTTNTSLLANSFHSQLNLSKTSKVNVLFSQLLPLSDDQYITEIEINDSVICSTDDCYENFKTQIESKVRQSSSLSLPFISTSDGSLVNISMQLYKIGTLFSNEHAEILTVCELIKKNLGSSSQLFYPVDVGYNQSIRHFLVSSTSNSICSVEPAITADVAMIMKLIGQYRVPFAVKGGGHTMNPHFSSTNGVHISMTRFQKVVYHESNQTVDVGAGLVWNDVYERLDPYNVTVVGGRFFGVGVGGLVLGGGYSWKSNQYGLSIDNVYEYELVSPNGTIVYVNNRTYADIFFGLKGGLNNFGVVTNFNMRAVPQTQVYGGTLYYNATELDAINRALVNFQSNNNDPKAQLMAVYVIQSTQMNFVLIACYDAPQEPAGIFDEFLNIPHFGSLEIQPYYSLANKTRGLADDGRRGRFATLSITTITSEFIQSALDELHEQNSTLGLKPGAMISIGFQTFLPNLMNYTHTAAYSLFASSTLVLPVFFQFSWTNASDDNDFVDAIRLSRNNLYQAALDQGQTINGSQQIQYPNYALDDAPLSQIYGSNLARLRSIRKAWDPNNIMYLTGGFKL